MIETLESISKKLRWTKPLVLIIGLICFILFFAAIFELKGLNSDIYLIPSVLGVAWAALFFFLLSTFPYVPAKPNKDEKYFAKLKIRVKRVLYHLLSVIFIVLTIAVIIVSFKLLSIWHTDF